MLNCVTALVLAGSHFVWRAERERKTAILIECSSILLTLNSVTPQNTPYIPGEDAHAPAVLSDANHKAAFSTVLFIKQWSVALSL
jgi:hypothetical protein